MPCSVLHLLIAKKVNPNASIGFFVGNRAPDSFRGNDIAIIVKNYADSNQGNESLTSDEGKAKAHFYHLPDLKTALREFALKANNDYLKGIVLHLIADKKFHTFWNENTSMPYREGIGKEFWAEYSNERKKATSYAYHNTEWISGLYKDMDNWDYNNFTEVEFITKDDVKWFIPWNHERIRGIDKLEISTIFPPAMVERFVNETVEDFNKWLSGEELSYYV